MATDISSTAEGDALTQTTIDLLAMQEHYRRDLEALRVRVRDACRSGRMKEALDLIPVFAATKAMVERIDEQLAGRVEV